MPAGKPTYHEQLLHWIWENRRFRGQQLVSAGGQRVHIHHTGQPNKSDGPDFRNAEVTIGRLRWHGDVEIHWKAADWRNHGHHCDPNYNKVILHVVFEPPAKEVLRKDRTAIPALCIGNYISKPLGSFLQQYLSHPQLPCAKHLSYISDEAFKQQIEKAHKEYFVQKVDDLSAFYDPSLPPSRAWLKLLCIGLFDGLGISHNREPMQELGAMLFNRTGRFSSAAACRRSAMELSGIRAGASSADKKLTWNHKGCRPNNHPEHRIQQGALGLWHICAQPFERWLREDPKVLWSDLLSAITYSPSLGKERASILFGTVFLPALYSLGNLFHAGKCRQRSWLLLQSHQVSLPGSLLKDLQKTDLPAETYTRRLGTVHQLRNYCKAGRCQNCFVFKSAISS